MKMLDAIRTHLEARDQATIDLVLSILARAKIVDMTDDEVATLAAIIRR